MQSRTNLLILVCLAGLALVGFAQETTALPVNIHSATDVNEPGVLTFPYVAEIIGNNVNVRSNAGTQYYPCGKLNKADIVEVVSSQRGWSCIVPPAGSFSWISMRFVNIDPDNPNIGIVTGDNVHVYVGAEGRAPIHSDAVQLNLKKGEKVALLGEEKDDYYKIVPPVGAYLWISTQFVKPLGPADKLIRSDTGAPSVVPTKIPFETGMLGRYYALEKRIEAERVKPWSQQDYADIKKALLQIAGNKKAGKAARYAEFAIKQIERFELALAAGEAVRLQDVQLQQIRRRIDKACAKRLAEVQDLGKFAVVGRFQTSRIYGSEPGIKRYRIVDDSGRIVCYALPSGSATRMDLAKLINHKVGLVGTIELYPQTASALVRFTKITELK